MEFVLILKTKQNITYIHTVSMTSVLFISVFIKISTRITDMKYGKMIDLLFSRHMVGLYFPNLLK